MIDNASEVQAQDASGMADLPVSPEPAPGGPSQTPPGQQAKKDLASGHFRVYPDGAVVGWYRNAADPAHKYGLTVTVDQTHAFATMADLPNFCAVPDGDGFNAFILFLPARFGDGAAHTITVAAGNGRMLKCKEPAFAFSAPPETAVVLTSIGGGVIRGRLSGITSSPRFPLELRGAAGGLISRIEPQWEKSTDAGTPFTLAAPPFDPMGLLNGALLLTYPGLAPEDCAPGTMLSLAVQRRQKGWMEVTCGLDVTMAFDVHLDVAAGAGGLPHPLPLRLENGRGAVALPAGLQAENLTVTLRLAGPHGPKVLEQDLPAPFASLVQNDRFAQWQDGGLLDWVVTGDVAACRPSYFSFRQQQFRTLRRPGVTAVLQVSPQSGGRVSISQSIGISSAPADAEILVIARASSRTELAVTLTAGDVALGEAALRIGREWTVIRQPWVWRRFPPPAGHAELAGSFVMAGEAGGFVELAMLTLAPAGGIAEAVEAEAIQGGANYIANADLTVWTAALKSEPANGRIETARGWHLYNRKAPAPRFMVSPADPARFGHYALSFGADRVSDYCRLEIALMPDFHAAGQGFELSFRCSIPAIPHALGLPPKARRWVPVDRIALLSRGEEGDDRVELLIARRVLITRAEQTYSFRFENPDPEAGTLAGSTRRYFVMMEIKEPFWLQIHGVTMKPAAGPAPLASPAGIRLEDPNIAAQAEILKGIGHWVNADAPSGRALPARSGTRALSRWNWSRKDAGAVEVVVCVYNAADETLACLNALATASSVPHTVRIIDDGSEADTANRIAAFIADKPWMHLDRNPENLGYTRSANRGILGSAADWVVLLNSDTIVSAGWLEALLACAASDPAIAFVGPLSNAASYQSLPELHDKSGKWAANDLPPGWTVDDMADFVRENSLRGYPVVPLLNGFCTLIRRQVFADLGGLNEIAFPMGYGEENDLCLRAVKEGHKLAVADDCYVFHAKSASFGQARRAALSKAGDKAFRELHADAGIAELTRQFGETPELARMRELTRQLYLD